jgi:hypothetical protein
MSVQANLLAGLLVGLLIASPLAAGLSWGVDARGISEVKAAGASPAYGQTWVGKWMKTSGWSGFENDLRTMSGAGVTPVIMWYYWGDSISVSCVLDGCNGMTKADWDAMAKDMATRAKNIMGTRSFLVVLEPEFNKNGISSWETFDGYLQSQAWSIKGVAPNAKIVTGFGSWGGWDIFDRAVGASDYTGFQIMRASTRNSAADATSSADAMIKVSSQLKSRFGKSVLVFDFAIGTYGGWEGVQDTALKNVGAKSTQLGAAGVVGIVWRYVRDNNYSSGYFGAAESTWGVKHADGSPKPGWWTLLSLVKNGTGSAAPPTNGTAPASAFSGVSGNEWWIQTDVAGSPQSVTASVNGGAPVAMPHQSWGAWAVSTHAPTGSSVMLRATYPDGTSAQATYAWPPGSAPAPSTFNATWTGMGGNSWWVQASVTGAQTIASVDARVNGGAWTSLVKQSWGAWAKSFYVAPGSSVQFRATSTTGATATSGTYPW